MLVRALVVLLLVINVGVAAWWTLRAPAPLPAAVEPPLGVARLQLVSEARKPAPAPAPISAPAAPSAPAPAAPVVATPATAPAVPSLSEPHDASVRCYSVGPFNDEAAAQHARELLMAVSTRVVPREQRAGTARGWRVYVPAAATPEAAKATADRISAAGFNDLMIVRQGSEANSIALGRYRNEDTAQRRAQSLVAAGFPARAEALGDGRLSLWLDLVAKPEFDPARVEAAVLVPTRPLECTRVR
ncbi:SPOR domain-containing protein [Lysobacter sp. LF1]|uniref:SPOR domain-containing protein n=1 Tax=Lysobacter stagni TaxID=3045172 RepID=A0ABT6XET3_9GAMM|nr:SPOR domain-containing protein [Lysobacter sp. LF1]MDI9238661.1 SPOR domain-containing protein [Lysobacter sp. LF1]